MSDDGDAGPRVRREPPPFRRVTVDSVDDLTPHMRRIVFGGPELAGFTVDAPGASVRLLLPPRGSDAIVMPTWTGNQFELPNGERAPIRTFTPRYVEPDPPTLTLDIVLHDKGAASDWARSATVGVETAVSGPGRGYQLTDDVRTLLLAGDESAIPAIAQLLEQTPETVAIEAHVEIASADARLAMPAHANATVTWHELPGHAQPGDTLVPLFEALSPVPDAIWAAGEAAGMQRIRNLLFVEAGIPRTQATIRGYWKHGRAATE